MFVFDNFSQRPQKDCNKPTPCRSADKAPPSWSTNPSWPRRSQATSMDDQCLGSGSLGRPTRNRPLLHWTGSTAKCSTIHSDNTTLHTSRHPNLVRRVVQAFTSLAMSSRLSITVNTICNGSGHWRSHKQHGGSMVGVQVNMTLQVTFCPRTCGAVIMVGHMSFMLSSMLLVGREGSTHCRQCKYCHILHTELKQQMNRKWMIDETTDRTIDFRATASSLTILQSILCCWVCREETNVCINCQFHWLQQTI